MDQIQNLKEAPTQTAGSNDILREAVMDPDLKVNYTQHLEKTR